LTCAPVSLYVLFSIVGGGEKKKERGGEKGPPFSPEREKRGGGEPRMAAREASPASLRTLPTRCSGKKGERGKGIAGLSENLENTARKVEETQRRARKKGGKKKCAGEDCQFFLCAFTPPHRREGGGKGGGGGGKKKGKVIWGWGASNRLTLQHARQVFRSCSKSSAPAGGGKRGKKNPDYLEAALQLTSLVFDFLGPGGRSSQNSGKRKEGRRGSLKASIPRATKHTAN